MLKIHTDFETQLPSLNMLRDLQFLCELCNQRLLFVLCSKLATRTDNLKIISLHLFHPRKYYIDIGGIWCLVYISNPVRTFNSGLYLYN
jgi:hypothetical protein